jgi:hypothetical protein
LDLWLAAPVHSLVLGPQFRVAVCSLVRGLVFQSALISCSSIFAHAVRGLLQEFVLVVFLSYQIKKLESF